jgi:hypothetical protein
MSLHESELSSLKDKLREDVKVEKKKVEKKEDKKKK